jgi:hypothetical protein
VKGVNEWLDLDEWPPPTVPKRIYLQHDGKLSADAALKGPPDRFRYDPADPTPDVGGTSDPKPGSRDNRSLEARSDVVTYTADPLSEALEITGRATVILWIRSSLKFTDVFCRLCDVYPSGKSMNVCDGIIRLTPGNTQAAVDGVCPVTVELWPTAHRFKAGHRIRLQVSSGSHPRFARNTGTGQPLGIASDLLAADQEIFHDPRHLSVVELPVHSPQPASNKRRC